MTKIIHLTNGGAALVDEEYYEFLMQWRWMRTSSGYAMRRENVGGKRRQVWMHRVINDTPPELFTDHINHDGLDNRKANLRNCSASQNKINSQKKKGASSKYRGVTYRKDKPEHPWHARIKAAGKMTNIGFFKRECDAAQAYNFFALNVHGKFANFNKA